LILYHILIFFGDQSLGQQVPEGLTLAQAPEPVEPPVRLLDIGSSSSVVLGRPMGKPMGNPWKSHGKMPGKLGSYHWIEWIFAREICGKG